MGHAVKSILSGDGTHTMPVADRSPLVVGIQELTDGKQVLSGGTKFRIYGFPSELSDAADSRSPERSQRTQRRKISRQDAKGSRILNRSKQEPRCLPWYRHRRRGPNSPTIFFDRRRCQLDVGLPGLWVLRNHIRNNVVLSPKPLNATPSSTL
jgi:hypothetical protein